jgi:hypothetical protein
LAALKREKSLEIRSGLIGVASLDIENRALALHWQMFILAQIPILQGTGRQQKA